MSGQRSDGRQRLHANPSRMEQELAIKLHKTTENRVRLATVPLIETRGLAQNSFSWREPSRKKVGGEVTNSSRRESALCRRDGCVACWLVAGGVVIPLLAEGLGILASLSV